MVRTDPHELLFLLVVLIGFIVFMRTALAVYRMKMTARQGGDISKRSGGLSADDIRIIQELHSGFEKLSQRVEALETILLDRVKKG